MPRLIYFFLASTGLLVTRAILGRGATHQLGGCGHQTRGLRHRLPEPLAGSGRRKLHVTIAEIVANHQVSLRDATEASILAGCGVLCASPFQGGLQKASHPLVLLGSGLQDHFKLTFHFSGGKKKVEGG